MAFIQTVRGPVAIDELGLILPHEHLFTDLRGPEVPGYAEADPEDVQRAMQPLLDAAWAAGVTALVECSTGGVGRNARVLAHLAAHTPLAIVAPTGVYREQYMPAAIRRMDEQALADWMTRDIAEGIDGTGVRAGFIKMAVSDGGITDHERRALAAAARAALATGVVVASHTSGPAAGAHALEELDILESRGLEPRRFIWVHTQNEADREVQRAFARRGGWLSYDALSPAAEDKFVSLVLWALDAGLARQVMLSHDAGWYRPGEPEGGAKRGYTYLIEGFLPRLRREGVSEETIRLLTAENPQRAFAVPAA